MKKSFKEEINILPDVQVSLDKGVLSFKGPKGENFKNLNDPSVQINVSGDNIVLSSKRFTKREKKLIGTFKAHIKNLMRGVVEGHVYKLKVCSSHFPMSVNINNDEFVVKNFFGEKHPRVLKLKSGADVKINGEEIVIESSNKEIGGQVAADIEQLTRITNKDRRVFQDGIYIIEKDGKAI